MQTIKNYILQHNVYTAFFAVLMLLFIFGCVRFGMRPQTKLELCWLIKGRDGPVLASYPNPDGYFIIHIVQPVCGQPSYWGKIYHCSTRLDLEITDDRTVEGSDMGGECNVSIKWLNSWEFEVTKESGEKQITNTIDAFGIMP